MVLCLPVPPAKVKRSPFVSNAEVGSLQVFAGKLLDFAGANREAKNHQNNRSVDA